MSLLISLLCAAAIFFIILFLIYSKAFYSPGGKHENIYDIPDNSQYRPHREHMCALIRDLESRPYEEVWIRSHDGLKLFARYYHYRDGAPLDIAFHGYRGTAIRDLCGGIRLSYAVNHNILLVDQRSHGRSEGCTITFGIKERMDCLSWVNYARKRFGEDISILLYGVSMGATTVLMASELDIGGNVRGIVADCPYSSPRKIIMKVSRDMNLPARAVYPLVKLAARIFGRFWLEEITAEEAVRNSSIPAIIIHGEADRFVPSQMSKSISDARPDIERYTFPDAGHGLSNIVDTPRYNELILDFIRRHFPEA